MQSSATVLVYSDDANTREQVRLAAGRRPAADVPPVEFIECATLPAVLKHLDEGASTSVSWTARPSPRAGWACAARSRTRSSAARRCCC